MDIFERIANADLSKLKDFGDQIREGEHLLALKAYGTKPTEEDGDIVAADFVVMASNGPNPHRVGSIVGCAWFVNKGSWKGEKELARALQFVRELCSADDSTTLAIIQSTAQELATKEQPGTGMQIRAVGKSRTSKTTQKAFVEVTFQRVPQDASSIAATRAKMASSTPAPVAAPAPVAQPSLLGSLK